MDSPSPFQTSPKPPKKTSSDVKDLEIILSTLATRVDQLETNFRRWCILHRSWNKNLVETTAKLKQTITAVERLAKGKSLGALGLPSEEEWDQGL